MRLTQVKPLGSKLLVKLLPLYSAHVLVIIKGGKHYEQLKRAVVLGVGPRVRELVVGDEVMFQGHAGKWVDDPELYGTYSAEPRYVVLEDKDVLAIYDQASVAA